jgi:hypothetical protein
MLKLIQYFLRVTITPIMILIIVLPAYYLKLIHNQSSFIIFLILAGISGQVIQYYVQQHHNRKNGMVKEKKEALEEVNEDPLSKLPKEVQDLIKEGESINQDEQEGYR